MKCESSEEGMLHWQTAATYYQAQAGYKREYPYGYDYPGSTTINPNYL